MKNLSGFWRSAAVLVLAMACSSCSNELDVLSEPVTEPVIFCVLGMQDSVYKVVLSKTFSGEQSAYEMAQDTAEIYYKNARITLEAWSQGYQIWETEFHPIQATRATGLFSSKPGYAYESSDVLPFNNEDSQVIDYVRLVVKTPDREEPAYARIPPYVRKPTISFPQPREKKFNLCDTIVYYLKMHGSPRRYYDLRCTFRYIEYTDAPRHRSVEFIIKQNLLFTDEPKILYLTPEVFFWKLAACFPPDTIAVDYRAVTTLDLHLCVGSETFKTYIDTYHSDNDNGLRMWNCFTGGIGVFALKNQTSLTNLEMDRWTKDSLANGSFTKHLKFTKW